MKMNVQHTQTYETLNTVLRGKFISQNAYRENLEKSHTSSLIAHLKDLKQKEANSPRRSRCQEIIKWRSEINKLDKKKAIERINEANRFFEVVGKLTR